MIGNGENGMGDGDRGTFFASPGGETLVLGLEVSPLFASSGMGGFGEGGAEVAIAVPGASMFTLARRAVVARAEFGPSGEVLSGGEATHVPADFDDEFLRHPGPDSGHRLQSLQVIDERAQAFPHFQVEPQDAGIEVAEMADPKPVLETKMTYDPGFAARFQKAIAILLSRRCHRLTEHPVPPGRGTPATVRDVLFVLGEFHDSDIDWFVAKGQRKKVRANTVLIPEGGPVDGLYMLLEGSLAVQKSQQLTNALIHNLLPPPEGQIPEKIVRHLYKGELFGLAPFLDAHQPTQSIKALKDCLVLFIPRQQFWLKLNQDVGFAAWFYGVITTMLSHRIQSTLNHLDPGRDLATEAYAQNGKSESTELDFGSLDQMAIAGTRFNWMLKRLSGTESA